MKLTRLDDEHRELLWIGITGVVGIACGLYALVFPAVAMQELLDSFPIDFVSGLIGVTAIFVATAVIAVELVFSAAAVRMIFSGQWPGRRFLLGPPAAVIAGAAYALAGALAVAL